MAVGGAILPCCVCSTWSTGVSTCSNSGTIKSCPCSKLDWIHGVMFSMFVVWGIFSEICLSTWHCSYSGSSPWSESMSESFSGTNFMPKGSSILLWSTPSFPLPTGLTLYTGKLLFGCDKTVYCSGPHLFWILCGYPYKLLSLRKTRSSTCNFSHFDLFGIRQFISEAFPLLFCGQNSALLQFEYIPSFTTFIP